jgi:glycosyltransferase involved in cell wall biosynthesis
MDGLEWKRSKYSKKVQWFLKHAEKWAAKHGDILIADSVGIQQHLKDTYNKDSVFIAYGAHVFETPDTSILSKYNVAAHGYHMLIARMEPENNIELIIKGYIQSKSEKPLLIIGKTENEFGTYLVNSYGSNTRICFLGGIYDQTAINNLRYYSHLYFHGHSVGGTNPSLLEAMASNALIAAHNNVFNKAILGDDAFYFSNPGEVAGVIMKCNSKESYTSFLTGNTQKIRTQYSWARITDLYEQVLLDAVK